MLTPEQQEIIKLEVNMEVIQNMLDGDLEYEEREALTSSYYLMLSQKHRLKESTKKVR